MRDAERQKQEEAKKVAKSLQSPEFIDGEAPETYKASLKTQTLPWHSFNQACIAVCFCWLFGLAYGIAVLTGYRWGWPDSNPFGNGEFTRRLSAAFFPTTESDSSSSLLPPFYRPTGVSNVPDLGLVFTSNEGGIFSPELGGDVPCEIPFGERAVDVAVSPSNATFAVLSDGALKRCQGAAEMSVRMNTGSAVAKAEFLADDEAVVVTREHPQWIQVVKYDGSSLVVERVLRAPGEVVGLARKSSSVDKLYVLWQQTSTEEHPDYAAGRIDLHTGTLEARASVHGDFDASVEWVGISEANNGQLAVVGISLKDQSPVVAPLRKLRPVVNNIGRGRDAETM
ncbi:hypothetical protein Pmar_PMAR007913 [Perkinsus marinus ATCC 50983]|uniref:Transmembrane protein n=1 Tax=Perkinsus marinus (strain ATCC 50983 / TXsc) TaxID=423536 RepID=C5KK26_PERM5|nr:hypothetical protein Pmar_PMAR007913 [Perkinsus marinus ATCC 50983]EER15167.1 hypothetical protein Pmar_PMAR007913 [Perkinsus marinus ATCC 50983]|eukprot:XP_002783371.1 hypothetical protein Pmar_PMAR007913 [Perkinsus marinus ATCC 50983]